MSEVINKMTIEEINKNVFNLGYVPLPVFGGRDIIKRHIVRGKFIVSTTDLGMKINNSYTEYEGRCFQFMKDLSNKTTKEISDIDFVKSAEKL